MATAPRQSVVDELRSTLGRALGALADVTRGQKPSGELAADVAELRDRVEYLEDSLAAFEARAERGDAEQRPWKAVRR